jgi:DNA-binding winged helix-turn-helix (wHTH) protein
MTNSVFHGAKGANRAPAGASLEFGRFRLLLRQRLLLADGVPIELGTRAFELLLALLEANGSLVSKEQILARVWRGSTVTEDNVKAQVFKLRSALGQECDFIRTASGRGYRFTAAVRATAGGSPLSRQCGGGAGIEVLFRRRITRRPLYAWSVRDRFRSHFVPARPESAASRQE